MGGRKRDDDDMFCGDDANIDWVEYNEDLIVPLDDVDFEQEGDEDEED